MFFGAINLVLLIPKYEVLIQCLHYEKSQVFGLLAQFPGCGQRRMLLGRKK